MKLDLTKKLVYKYKGKEYKLTLSSIKNEDVIEASFFDEELSSICFIHFKDNGYEYVYDINKEKYVRKSHTQVVRNVEEAEDLRKELDELKEVYAISQKKLQIAINNNYILRKENEELRAEVSGWDNEKIDLRKENESLKRELTAIKLEIGGYSAAFTHVNTLNTELSKTNSMLNKQTAKLTEELNRAIEQGEKEAKRAKVLLEDYDYLYDRIIEATRFFAEHRFKAAWRIINAGYNI